MAAVPFSSTQVIAVILALGFIALAYTRRTSRARQNLPPGPKGVPLFGNLFQVPALRPHPLYCDWAREYGPIFHFKIGPQDLIVLNTAEATEELFVRRGNNYSSRAPPHVAHDIMSAGQRMAFLPYDREWKAVRRSLQGSIGPGASKKLRPRQDLEAKVLLYDLLSHGDMSVTQPQVEGAHGKVPELHWFSIIRRYTTSIVMTAMYDKRIHRITNNPYLHKIYDVVDNFTKVAQPGNYIADAFPILRKLPDFLAPWRLEARKMHEWEMELWGGLLDDIKKDTKKGISRGGYVGDYLEQRTEHGQEDAPGCELTDDGWLRDKLLAYAAGSVLEAGSDTTASTLQSFILFMLGHPYALTKVRDEVERVVGEERMPTFGDEPSLPYLIACIKETLRLRPPAIMGIPHSADQDDVYGGYHIPKGSTVIGNIWAIHMDPVRYPNPRAFNPDRFYKEDKPTRWGSGPDAADRDQLSLGGPVSYLLTEHTTYLPTISYVFGWGRRFCQGSSIAEASLFIVLSRIIWGIDFEAPTDPKTGHLLVPDMNDEEATFTDGFVSNPRIFPVKFKARSVKKADVIMKAFEAAQAEWQILGMATDER